MNDDEVLPEIEPMDCWRCGRRMKSHRRFNSDETSYFDLYSCEVCDRYKDKTKLPRGLRSHWWLWYDNKISHHHWFVNGQTGQLLQFN